MRVTQLYLLLFIVLSCFSKNIYAENNDKDNIKKYVPKSPLHLLESMDKRIQCANKKVVELVPNKQRIIIGKQTNATGNPLLPDGMYGMFHTSIYNLAKSSQLKLIDTTYLNGALDPDYIIIGQQSSFDRGYKGSENGWGLFTKYFGVGFGDSSNYSLLQADFRLVNKDLEVVAVASFGQVLSHLDTYTEYEAEVKQNGLYIDYGNNQGESLGFAQRIIVNQVSLLFMEKIVGQSLKCSAAELSKFETKDQVLSNNKLKASDLAQADLFLGDTEKKYFHKVFKKSLNCNKRKTTCYIRYKKSINKDVLAFAEDTLIRKYGKIKMEAIQCKKYRGQIRCRS